MSLIHSNNYRTSTTSIINNSVTTLPVASVTKLPAIGGGVYCYLTLQAGNVIEIVKATAVSGLNITIVRAQQGTVGVAFASDIVVSLRPTKESFDSKIEAADTFLLYTSVAITTTEFKGMYAAPKVLIAAPGANKLISLSKMQLLMTYGSAAYAAGGTVAVQYDTTVNGAGVIASTTLANTAFQPVVSTGWNFNPGVVAEPFTTTVNKSLALSNITSAFTTGNSAMVAHLWYQIIPTV